MYFDFNYTIASYVYQIIWEQRLISYFEITFLAEVRMNKHEFICLTRWNL